MRRMLSRVLRPAIAILVIAALGLASAAYILLQERLRPPGRDTYTVTAELADASGVQPGFGLAVNVAGVDVGAISGLKVKDGRALLEMEIRRSDLPEIHRDARAMLRPPTPIKDMEVELYPGSPGAPRLPAGASIPISRTFSPLDLEELLSSLDGDTRDWLQSLASAARRGTDGRGRDLRALLRTLGPTTRQVRRVGDALAGRREEIRRLVHDFAVLGRATAQKDGALAEAVSAGDATLHTLADESPALRAALDKLPGTLDTLRSTFRDTTPFAHAVAATLPRLQPAVRALPGTLRALAPVLHDAPPTLAKQVRPLVRESVPLLHDLAPTAQDLSAVTPSLISAFQVLTYVVNETAYNPPGDEEGYLFWTAWLAHNADSLMSAEDAHGAIQRGIPYVTCSSLASTSPLAPLVHVLAGISALDCPKAG